MLEKLHKKKEKIDGAVNDMKLISGQQPVVTKARKSVAGFKLKRRDKCWSKSYFRKNRMYEFLDRLVNIALA